MESESDAGTVEILYETIKGAEPQQEATVEMSMGADGKYRGVVPGQEAGVLVRIRVRTVVDGGGEHLHPDPNALRPAMSLYVMDKPEPATIPLAFIVNLEPEVVRSTKRALQATEQVMPARFVRARVQATVDSLLNVASVWSRLNAEGNVSQKEYLQLRELLTQQAKECAQRTEEALAEGDMRAAMRKAQTLARSAKADFDKRLADLLPAEKLAAYQKGNSDARDGSDQFLRQMLPAENLWLTIATEFECTDQQRKRIQTAMTKVVSGAKGASAAFLAEAANRTGWLSRRAGGGG